MSENRFQFVRHQLPPLDPDEQSQEPRFDGLWATNIPMPLDAYADEYALGTDDARIIRVAGVRHRYDGVGPSLFPTEPLLLVHEESNRFDPEAVAVIGQRDGLRLGYLPRLLNRGVMSWIGYGTKAWVLCHWVNPVTHICWDGDEGGTDHILLSAHILIARSSATDGVEDELSVYRRPGRYCR